MTSPKPAATGSNKPERPLEREDFSAPLGLPAERAPRIEEHPGSYAGPLYQSRHNYPSA